MIKLHFVNKDTYLLILLLTFMEESLPYNRNLLKTDTIAQQHKRAKVEEIGNILHWGPVQQNTTNS